jgi:tetratricopeptide (TPR) repeat protein
VTQRVFSYSVLCAAAIAIGGATAPRACAQPSKAKSPSAAMLREAYQLTRVADSESDYARIIALCEEGANSAPATGSTAQYAAKLKRWALEARGESRFKEGRAAEALVDFDEAHRLDPRNPRVLRLRGVCQARLGRPDEALVDLDKSIELHHGDARSFVERGEVRYALGRYAEAARDFDQALRLKPRDTAAHVGRGHARYRLKQFAAAAQDYTTALATRRQDAPLYTQRGQAFAELGRYTEAANDFRRAMRIDPNYGKAFQSAAWLMATCPDPRHRDDLLAIELSKRSIDLDGKLNPRYLETLAAALANAGYFDEARQVQEKAMEKTSEKSLARSTARRDLFAAGRPYREGRTRR